LPIEFFSRRCLAERSTGSTFAHIPSRRGKPPALLGDIGACMRSDTSMRDASVMICFIDGIAQNSLLNLPKAQKPARRRSGTCANAVPSGPICRGGGRRSRSVGDLDSGGIKDRASILLSRIEAQAGRTITRGTGILASDCGVCRALWDRLGDHGQFHRHFEKPIRPISLWSHLVSQKLCSRLQWGSLQPFRRS
jgi:hypothetical protein